jgi:hypothetical protein
MAHHFDALNDEALHGYLTRAAVERGERFVVEQRGDEWIAEFQVSNPLAGEVVPLRRCDGGPAGSERHVERERS